MNKKLPNFYTRRNTIGICLILMMFLCRTAFGLEISDLWLDSDGNVEIVPYGMQQDALVYLDRDYTYSEIPEFLRGLTTIQLANADKFNDNGEYLIFNVDKPVDIHVFYDKRYTEIPGWLSSYFDTQHEIKVDGVGAYKVFKKSYPAGDVVLGGNYVAGQDNNSMFAVAISEKTLEVTAFSVENGEDYEVIPKGMRVGTNPYGDRNYQFSSIPSLLQGAALVKTYNNDKFETDNEFISIEVNVPVNLYVLYDNRYSKLPDWLKIFVDTGEDVTVRGIENYSVYKRPYSAGRITLGGNYTESEGNNGMYILGLVPNTQESIKPDVLSNKALSPTEVIPDKPDGRVVTRAIPLASNTNNSQSTTANSSANFNPKPGLFLNTGKWGMLSSGSWVFKAARNAHQGSFTNYELLNNGTVIDRLPLPRDTSIRWMFFPNNTFLAIRVAKQDGAEFVDYQIYIYDLRAPNKFKRYKLGHGPYLGKEFTPDLKLNPSADGLAFMVYVSQKRSNTTPPRFHTLRVIRSDTGQSLCSAGLIEGRSITAFQSGGSVQPLAEITQNQAVRILSVPGLNRGTQHAFCSFKKENTNKSTLVPNPGNVKKNVVVSGQPRKSTIVPTSLKVTSTKDLINPYNKPPKVSISVSKNSVKVGEYFEVTVKGWDGDGFNENGLSDIWWWDNKGKFMKKRRCNGLKICVYTWKVKATSSGKYKLYANARDRAYGLDIGHLHQANDGIGLFYWPSVDLMIN